MTDNLQFFAYGNPGTGALTYNQPAAGAIYPSITYTVADVVTQTDLVAAKAMDATKASNASGVSLKFGHILTQINFTVKAADALTYKLKTLTISGVHNKELMVLMIQHGSHRKERLLMHIRLTVVHWK